ncbi:hypothetical protein MPTK1_2g11270 [Marchantia polymorpha subsp. ruderalis]|uniref:Uncharacterized protein n=1 Tax=Marchantia polymorpha TaxID=3197 RepID=A0A2R6XCE6_MARPO|nr:hypothetical protein MARPO_0023s0095 [Marchantia polymorpha]BBN01920.1 hypothetical protein Mp_2g11270 [Marchantia polymorpha subsp. ruderalis]|eukprot:PTQ43786.1 hypothetical protein MARPO_0023s0095 [Marchantia polymorpha]
MHGEGLTVAVAVVEGVAGVAKTALEKRHHDHSPDVVAREKEILQVEDALEQQRLENQRLRAQLEEYQKALDGMHSRSSQETPSELYARLKKKVDSPEFLSKLTNCSEDSKSPDGMVVSVADDPSSWLMVTDNDLTDEELKEEGDQCGQDAFVVVTQEDIVDGIASFMARYISSNPQTKAMSPQELQKAISQAFTDLERKGKLRKLWNCGKFVYSAASWGATAAELYKSPVIVRAAMMAVWASCRVIKRLLV